MASRYLMLLALGTAVITLAVTVQCCPKQCSCSDKNPHHFVDCAYKELQLVPEGLPSNVTTLSLSANKIKVLKSQSFVNVTQATSLWLAHNEIVTIERNALAPMFQLRNLDLSHNKIVNFPWEDLANLTALQLLKMNNNEMVSLPKDAFTNLKDLRSVRINNNKFTTIAEGTFDALISMSHLQIYNNPFTCSCKLEWMRDWITKSKSKISIPEQNNIRCEAPSHLKGLEVTQMPKLVCQAPTVTITHQPNIENTEIHEGYMVILHCEVKGSPKPDVEWEVFAGNQLLTFPLPLVVENSEVPINGAPSNTRFLIFQNGTLTIPHMSKKENGNYSCSATNSMGKAENTVKLAMTVTKIESTNSVLDTKGIGPTNNNSGPKDPNNNVWPINEKPKILSTGTSSINTKKVPVNTDTLPFTSKCGISHGTQYISNHAFNLSLDDLKQYTFDFGVIALEVSETEAKVQLNPLQMANAKSNLHLNQLQDLETVDKEPFTLYQSSSRKSPIDMLYVCVSTGNGHSVVQWSKIEDGVNTYRFQGLRPGTNYTLCLTYGGQDCQVQVVFTTRKKIPSLLIIVVVSIFLLALATVPLLGATCCHLLYKYQGKTYKLIMKTQNADQMEKHISTDFDPRASFVGSEKNFNASELGEGDAEADVEEGEGEGEEVEGSVVTESIPESQSKTQEEFEVGSEYSDRLPLGAEAVNISEEINGNYKELR
ncbi:immunoglobulin superfamily containing leucine-rich repeat protein 2 isoform X2 [Ictalurus furcatus]|nr:immunoglobulin superfamily containing leucine-rich repeat protein 2 isoform X2 [Ictalurus furcatus]XP_053497283.1 immunoglobulin superfamily containing leucine-rich repeat protein 2 isoform X2 [Ictalurus furcatus]XP_053497284.1 immunoglobulin superfamily containing leucine-rich repeat protein 2 isoform X2 [Ictalurus furcatus]XP_053497285.1 immunoglobulin superfamily containing leucine-rich repeat protein 2 isoform X2 [Ictalurus furcatus]XP_053497286.1 immunoglobulin superfamily containing le